ncbi:hypothetical protein ES705_11905 [subsurface metagenome]
MYGFLKRLDLRLYYYPYIRIPENLETLLNDPEINLKPEVLNKELLLTKLLNITYPNIKAGLTEDYFYKKLVKYFPSKIFRNRTYRNHDFILRPYSPDFLYLDEKAKLCIAIEIDEPYVAETGKPIHNLYDNDEFSREEEFLSFGWIIVRFSEKQIVEFHKRCCKEIANIVSILKFENCLIPDLINEKWLSYDRRWNGYEAYKMALNRYRSSYLSKSLTKGVDIDNFTNDEIEKFDNPFLYDNGLLF